MKSFHRWLLETMFADLQPSPGEWMPIPMDTLRHASREPGPNIDTQLFDLIHKAYSPLGGYPNFRSASDLPSDVTMWFGIDVDGNGTPDAVSFGKYTSQGIKWTGMATDGSSAAKAMVLARKAQDLTTPGNYAEVSGASAHIMITRYAIPYIEDQATVERVLNKSVCWIGAHPDGKYPGYNGWYSRTLTGHSEETMKILLGVLR